MRGPLATKRSGTAKDSWGSALAFHGQARIGPIGMVGSILVLGVVVALTALFFHVRGSSLARVEVAVWLLSLVVFVLALCILYVLLTVRSLLEMVHAQVGDATMTRREQEVAPRPTQENDHGTLIEVEATALPEEPRVSKVPPTPSQESRNVTILGAIGPVHAQRLESAGIRTLDDLRRSSSQSLMRAAGVLRPVAERWKGMAELLVLRSMRPSAAELLVACNVCTLSGLAAQQPSLLHRRCIVANNRGENQIMKAPLTEDVVRTWIEEARARLGKHDYEAVPQTGTATGSKVASSNDMAPAP